MKSYGLIVMGYWMKKMKKSLLLWQGPFRLYFLQTMPSPLCTAEKMPQMLQQHSAKVHFGSAMQGLDVNDKVRKIAANLNTPQSALKWLWCEFPPTSALD